MLEYIETNQPPKSPIKIPIKTNQNIGITIFIGRGSKLKFTNELLDTAMIIQRRVKVIKAT
jgi:hypothetical protein